MDKNPQLPDEVVEKILRSRDALVYDDRDEAYHQLYAIACPNFDSFFPWKQMEEQINYPNTFKPDIEARRQVTEYATKLNAARALLQRAIDSRSLHNVKDYELLTEIKTFLDGKA